MRTLRRVGVLLAGAWAIATLRAAVDLLADQERGRTDPVRLHTAAPDFRGAWAHAVTWSQRAELVDAHENRREFVPAPGRWRIARRLLLGWTARWLGPSVRMWTEPVP
jgi:hypothetical protein